MPPAGVASLATRMTNETSAAPRRRYLTWRYPDRHFSKVHILGEDALPLCGGRPGREMGRPTPPIPEDALCDECMERDSSS